ncbi:hypothetical protein V3C99_010403, partial [Haemonchus contortus]
LLCSRSQSLERRRIDFCAVQETRLSCYRSRDIGPKTTNGVGIIASKRLRDSIVSVERFDDRPTKIVVVIEGQKYHLFSACAPQTGCSEQTKDTFWNLLDEKTAEVPIQEAIAVVGHRDQGLVTDVKTVPYETVTTQHRLLICTLKIAPPKPKLAESILLPAVATVDETCKGAAEAITQVARSKLGMTKPGRRKLDKQTWLWTDHVRDKVHFTFAKTRNRQTEDIEKFFGINDENGRLLTYRRQTLKSTSQTSQEFAHPAIPRAPPVCSPAQKITVKSGKATGPDDLAADLWKLKGYDPAGWLKEFFNQVVAEEKVPENWQQSTTIPVWKKGSLGTAPATVHFACSRTAGKSLSEF